MLEGNFMDLKATKTDFLKAVICEYTRKTNRWKSGSKAKKAMVNQLIWLKNVTISNWGTLNPNTRTY